MLYLSIYKKDLLKFKKIGIELNKSYDLLSKLGQKAIKLYKKLYKK